MNEAGELKGSYRGIPLSAMKIVVEESSVQSRMKELLDSVSWHTVSDKVRTGDRVNLSYTATISGLPFPGSSSDDSVVVIGSDDRVKGFDEGLVGHKVTEHVRFDFRFPDFHAIRACEGRSCIVEAFILRVQRRVGYELTDEYVRAVSEFLSVKELHDEIYRQMQEENAVEERRFLRAQIERALADLVPDGVVAEQVAQGVSVSKERLINEAAGRGISYDEYLGDVSDDPEKALLQAVETEAKVAYAVRIVQLQEGLIVSPEEIREEVNRMGLALETEFGLGSESDLESAASTALSREKVFDFVAQHAVFEEYGDE